MANVPWFHRHVIGHAAALWRTIWLATFQTQRLIDEVERDTLFDVAAARSFRRMCVVIAAASVALLLALLMAPFLPVPLGCAVVLPPLLLFFRMTTLLMDASELAYWPARSARFVTLHDFTAAPLLFLPLGVLAAAFYHLTGRGVTLAVLLTMAIIVQWLVCTFRYQKGATGRGMGWLLTRMFVTAIVWGSFAWFCFLAIMLLVAFSNKLIDDW
jgi:hypothetical protein